MAIVKHIKSRNANYSAAINYLLFEHDEKTGKKIVDESGRSILRKEFVLLLCKLRLSSFLFGSKLIEGFRFCHCD